jgi:hypothetical protein
MRLTTNHCHGHRDHRPGASEGRRPRRTRPRAARPLSRSTLAPSRVRSRFVAASMSPEGGSHGGRLEEKRGSLMGRPRSLRGSKGDRHNAEHQVRDLLGIGERQVPEVRRRRRVPEGQSLLPVRRRRNPALRDLRRQGIHLCRALTPPELPVISALAEAAPLPRSPCLIAPGDVAAPSTRSRASPSWRRRCGSSGTRSCAVLAARAARPTGPFRLRELSGSFDLREHQPADQRPELRVVGTGPFGKGLESPGTRR